MVAAAALSIGSVTIASPVLAAYGAEPSPTVRVLAAMKAAAQGGPPVALGMHQTFKRPLEAEDVAFATVLPSPPRLEWLELTKFWRAGRTEPVWFLADPARSDLALIDPASLSASTEFRWPLVARPAFGGMRPSAVRWYRLPTAWLVCRRRLVAHAGDRGHVRPDGTRAAPCSHRSPGAPARRCHHAVGRRPQPGGAGRSGRAVHVGDRRHPAAAVGRRARFLPAGVRDPGWPPVG